MSGRVFLSPLHPLQFKEREGALACGTIGFRKGPFARGTVGLQESLSPVEREHIITELDRSLGPRKKKCPALGEERLLPLEVTGDDREGKDIPLSPPWSYGDHIDSLRGKRFSRGKFKGKDHLAATDIANWDAGPQGNLDRRRIKLECAAVASEAGGAKRQALVERRTIGRLQLTQANCHARHELLDTNLTIAVTVANASGTGQRPGH